jgi:hypothetical protein
MNYHNPLRILLLVAAVALIGSTAWVPASAIPAASGPTRIRFDHGATSGEVDGDLAAHSSARYVLRAAARQLMDVTLSAPEGVTLKVTTTGGRRLTPVEDTSGPTGFRGYLPYTGDYYLTISSGDHAASYSVNVFIPVRVSFDLGTTSDSLEASLEPHQGLDYILRAGEGQVLEVNVTPDPADVNLQLIIYGVDGTVLRSGMGEGSTFRGELPSSQDYLVAVRAGDDAADFTMDVIIPQRISFARGAYSGSVRTYLRADHTQYYVVRASEDQTMGVELSPSAHLDLAVYGADGTVLENANTDGDFAADLPSSQDYILAVTNTGDRAVSYRVRVTIR